MSDTATSRPEEPQRLLSGDLRRTVLWLALPALAEQFLNFCVGLFDTFLAGRASHSGLEVGLATSAVGISAYMSWLASLLFALVGTGTTALVSRSWGQGEHAQANRFANCSLTLAGGLGVLIFCLLYGLAPWYARMQNMHGESYDIVVNYLRTDAIGELFYGFCLIGAAALRGTGDMRTPMVVLGLVNILNIIVSSVLTFGYGPIEPWGLRGIVGGTVVARICGGLMILWLLASGISNLKLRLSELVPHKIDVMRILRIGAPAGVDGALMWFGQSIFLMIIARLQDADLGKANMAAHMIGIEVEAFTYLPAVAWSYAAATVIGQNLGANEPERARRAGHIAVLQCSVIAIIGAAVYLFGAPLIYHAMTTEPAVWSVGIPAMRVLALYQIPLVLLIVYLGAMRGAGDTFSPLVINLSGVFLIRIPLGYLFGIVLQGGLIGAWSAMVVDVSLRALITWIRYRQGRWAQVKV